MTWPLVKFVSAPSTTAAVRMDLARDSVHVKNDGFSLGHPSFAGNPLTIGVDYGYRSLQMTVHVDGPKATALAELQNLARQIVRRDNWLMVQMAPGLSPMWLRVYRGEPGDLSMENAGVDVWNLDVPLTCEGFAYGAKVTIGPVTINNDPAAGSNPCRYVITDTIKGDAPAPCTVDITPSVSWPENQPLFAMANYQAAAPAATVWQTGGFPTAGTDTTLSTADAAFSGGSRSTVTFATDATMVTRINGIAPAAPPAGHFRVLLRLARSDTSSTFAARLMQVGLGGILVGNGVTGYLTRSASAAAGHACLIDLGEFSFPRNAEGWDTTEIGTPAAPDLALQVQRLSGTGSAYLDYLVLIPVSTIDTLDTRMMRSFFRTTDLSSSRNGIWDADRERFRAMNFGVALAPGTIPELAGAFPLLYPGAGQNALFLHHQVGGDYTPNFNAANVDTITATAAVTFSYYPRYLNLPGD